VGAMPPPRCLQGFFKVILKIKVCLILKLLCFLQWFFLFCCVFQAQRINLFFKTEFKKQLQTRFVFKVHQPTWIFAQNQKPKSIFLGGYPPKHIHFFFGENHFRTEMILLVRVFGFLRIISVRK